MQYFKQFKQLQSDLSSLRITITIMHILTFIVILSMQYRYGLSVVQVVLLIILFIIFSVMHWYSDVLLVKIKSLYFAIQGMIMVACTQIVVETTIIILIGLAGLVVIQAIYYYETLAEVTIFILCYAILGCTLLYYSYGTHFLWFYVCIFIISFVLIFLIFSIYNRKDLENLELVKANEKIEQLTLQHERQRMARDLHDTLIQRLVGVNLKIDAIEAHLKKGNIEKAEAIVGIAKSQIKESITEARKVVDDLRLHHDDLPFQDKLTEEIKQLQFTFHIPISIEIDYLASVNSDLAEHIIAIVREAVTNIYKHAHAKVVHIKFIQIGNDYQLIIQDDGIGINVQSARQKEGHYGLLGIQERVQILKGQLFIANNKGTEIKITIPMGHKEGTNYGKDFNRG